MNQAILKNNTAKSTETYSDIFGQPDAFDWLSLNAPASLPLVTHIVEVQFKNRRKAFFQNDRRLALKNMDLVIVSARGGYDIGRVALTGAIVLLQLKRKKVLPEAVAAKIYRLPNALEIQHWKMAKLEEPGLLFKAKLAAAALDLNMKLCDADLRADRSTVSFYYTAPARVDFRGLVKVLADELRLRIQMIQISLTEEQSRLGDIDLYGRSWCCHNWANHLQSRSIGNRKNGGA